MNDRELLESAARAVGYEIEHYRGAREKLTIVPPGGINFVFWNPLIDDGDAFRLATKLGLMPMHNVTLGDVHVFCEEINGELPGECYDDHNGDRCAATRRAIVRAAAEIGKKVDAPQSAG